MTRRPPDRKENIMTVKVPGYSTLTGTPETILDVMKAASFNATQSAEDYIKNVQETARRRRAGREPAESSGEEQHDRTYRLRRNHP